MLCLTLRVRGWVEVPVNINFGDFNKKTGIATSDREHHFLLVEHLLPRVNIVAQAPQPVVQGFHMRVQN